MKEQKVEFGLSDPRRFGVNAMLSDPRRFIELESDRRRLEWLVINNARVWLQDGWYDIHDSGGTCIVHMVDDWRDAIDKAMQEGE
jgi:hypothetical protein